MGNSRLKIWALMTALLGLQLSGSASAQTFAPPTRSGSSTAPADEPLAQIAVLGQVGRPGVYELRSARPELSELINTAGGLTSEASPSLRLVRQGRGGQVLFFQQGVSSPLMNGDLIIADRRRGGSINTASVAGTAGNPLAPPGTIQIGVIGLLGGLSRPVVIDVPTELTTVQGVLGLLNQPTAGKAAVTVIRPGAPAQTLTLTQAAKLNVASSTVLVLEPRSIDVQNLPTLPEPFRAPNWGRRDDAARPRVLAGHVPAAGPGPSYPAQKPTAAPAGTDWPAGTDRGAPALTTSGTPLIAPLPALRPNERNTGNPGPGFFSPPGNSPLPESSLQQDPSQVPLQSPTAERAPPAPVIASSDVSPIARQAHEQPDLPQASEPEPADLFPPAPVAQFAPVAQLSKPAAIREGGKSDLAAEASGIVESKETSSALPKSTASDDKSPVVRQRSQASAVPLLIAAVGASTCLALMFVLWTMDRRQRRQQADPKKVPVAKPPKLPAAATKRFEPQTNTVPTPVMPPQPNILDALIENRLALLEEPLALPHPLRIHGRPVGQVMLRADAAHETAKPHFLSKESPPQVRGLRRSPPSPHVTTGHAGTDHAAMTQIASDETIQPAARFARAEPIDVVAPVQSSQRPLLARTRAVPHGEASEAKQEPGLLDRALSAVRGERP